MVIHLLTLSAALTEEVENYNVYGGDESPVPDYLPFLANLYIHCEWLRRIANRNAGISLAPLDTLYKPTEHNFEPARCTTESHATAYSVLVALRAA